MIYLTAMIVWFHKKVCNVMNQSIKSTLETMFFIQAFQAAVVPIVICATVKNLVLVMILISSFHSIVMRKETSFWDNKPKVHVLGDTYMVK